MSSYFQDIIALLINPPGNLVYHLVLAFSVAGALAFALNYWQRSGEPQGRRMVIGLSALLLLRLVLFIAAGMAWQGVINGNVIMPPLDRAINLMGLVLIVWMWVFPQPTRFGDAASLLLTLLVATLFVFSLVWWNAQSTQSDFIGSWSDTAMVMLSIAISTAGGLLLALKRPYGWGYGLGMLFILLVGDVAYLTYPYPEGDFAGAVRLAQMIAYPMLLILPLRFSDRLKVGPPTPEPSQILQDRPTGGERQTDLFYSLLSLVNEKDPDRLQQSIVKLVAQAWLADLCLLVSPPGAHGKIEILAGYDLIQEHPLGKSILNSQSVPVIASALRRGRALRLPASSTSPDLAGLSKLLEIKSIGHLLVIPLVDDKSELIAGLILLTPYTKRSWSIEDQNQLTDICQPLAHVLQHNQSIASLQEDSDRMQAQLRSAQDEAEQFRRENELIIAQLGVNLEHDDDHQMHAASLAALLAAHEAAQEKIEKLQTEIYRLQQDVLVQAVEPQVGVEGDNGVDETAGYSEAHAEAELRLALEEVAYLKSLIYESDRKLLEFQEESANHSPDPKQVQEIATLAQELRQPMSSIIGYTDFLLEESIGILGALQRRFLERIRSSAERMTGMLDNLSLVAEAANVQPEAAAESINVPDLIDEAISRTSDRMRKKNIALRMELPRKIPIVSNSKAALQSLLETLLDNASQASPENGEITLRLRLEGEDGVKDFVLIQVADQGGGLAQQSATALNAAVSSSKSTQHPGMDGNRERLVLLRSLAESLGGRIWVDNNPGVGSIYSLLFPMHLTSDFNENGSRGLG
jgi:signal transduction histidine kinase